MAGYDRLRIDQVPVANGGAYRLPAGIAVGLGTFWAGIGVKRVLSLADALGDIAESGGNEGDPLFGIGVGQLFVGQLGVTQLTGSR